MIFFRHLSVALILLAFTACQSSTETSPQPNEDIEKAAPATKESAAKTSPAEAPFDFTQVQKDYLTGKHDPLVNYLNKGITEVIKGSKKTKGKDLKILNQSIEDCKVLGVKFRRNHFKEAPILANAVARMEINQARNYLLIAKADAVENPETSRELVANAIQKLEFNVEKIPSAYRNVVFQKISELKKLSKKSDTAYAQELSALAEDMTIWLTDNKQDLGISIPPK